jgi:predicted acyltransferase
VHGFAGIYFVYLSRRALAVMTVVLLVGYWAMLTFIPFPD